MRFTKKRPTKFSKKAAIIAVAAVVLIASALSVYVFAFKGSLFGWQPTKEASTTQPETKDGTPAQKETPATAGEGTNNSAKNADSSNTTPPAPTTTNDLRVIISSWSSSHVGVLINGVVTGTCILQLTKPGSDTITMTAATQPGPTSYTTCQGFDFSPLSGAGWTATVSVNAGNETGSASQAL